MGNRYDLVAVGIVRGRGLDFRIRVLYFYRLVRIVDVGVGGDYFAALLGGFEGYQALAGIVAGVEGEH